MSRAGRAIVIGLGAVLYVAICAGLGNYLASFACLEADGVMQEGRCLGPREPFVPFWDRPSSIPIVYGAPAIPFAALVILVLGRGRGKRP